MDSKANKAKKQMEAKGGRKILLMEDPGNK